MIRWTPRWVPRAAKLRELQERDLSGEDVVALVLDGKTFAGHDGRPRSNAGAKR